MNCNERFRQLCRERMKELDISAYELAERTGLPPMPFYRLVSKTNPKRPARVSLDTAVAAAKVLGLSLDDLKS